MKIKVKLRISKKAYYNHLCEGIINDIKKNTKTQITLKELEDGYAYKKKMLYKKETVYIDMKAKKRGFIGNIKKYWQLYLFLLLPLAYIIVFAYGPMVGLQIAFRDFNASKGIFGSPWVGLKYFEKFIHSYQFGRIIRNTFVSIFI